jgi:hypothetical protein
LKITPCRTMSKNVFWKKVKIQDFVGNFLF